jgi:hypothetical protein
MSDSRVIDGTLFVPNDQTIMYTAPKASPQGAKSVNILNRNTKSALTLSTPLMLTWGAGEFVDQATGTGDGKFTLSLQFPQSEYANEDTNRFLANMIAFEQKIKADALANSKLWFGRVHTSPDVIDALYTPMLKYTKDKTTGLPDVTKAPTLRVKLQKWEGVWKFEIYGEDGDRLFPSESDEVFDVEECLKKGSNIMTLIQFAGIWFVNGKFSASWKLVQAAVQKPKPTLQGKCFLKIKSEDKQKLSEQAVDFGNEEESYDVSMVNDSDDEGTQLDSVVENVVLSVNEVTPVKAEAVDTSAAIPKKRVVKRKESDK